MASVTMVIQVGHLEMVFAFDLEKHQWEKLNSLSKKTMDHRGLLYVNGTLYTLGGMGEKQQVLTGIQMISMD